MSDPQQHIVAIDPGLRHCGVAWFVDRELQRAELVKNPEKKLRGPVAHAKMAEAVAAWFHGYSEQLRDESLTLILEYPRVYPKASAQKGDPNDLLELAGVDGALTQALTPDIIISYFPADWKGQVPKAIMNARVMAKLSNLEALRLASSDHNTLDAVGIGLKHLVRL